MPLVLGEDTEINIPLPGAEMWPGVDRWYGSLTITEIKRGSSSRR